MLKATKTYNAFYKPEKKWDENGAQQLIHSSFLLEESQLFKAKPLNQKMAFLPFTG